MECLAPYIPPALLPYAEQIQAHIQEQSQTLAIAAVSVATVFLSYLFVAGRRETPATVTVPNPPELDDGWVGTKWEDLPEGSVERGVIEGQVRGVSIPFFSHALSQLGPRF